MRDVSPQGVRVTRQLLRIGESLGSRIPRLLRQSLAVALAIGVAGAAAAPAIAATRPVVVIVMENKSYDNIVGSADAPFINKTMIAHGVLATNYHANVPVSLRDYLAMTAGITDSTAAGPSENIFHQLQTSGQSWAEYMESMPSPCFTGRSAGDAPGTSDPLYTIGHNPAIHFQNIKSQAATCRSHLLPYSSFTPEALPSFSFVVPNQCNDMHSRCAGKSQVRTGDDWLAANVPAMVSGGATVILTWDESSGAQHVVTVTYGVGQGKDARAYTHFNLLAGLEQRFGLPAVNKAVGAQPFPIP
jgi:phosphatidylinositol-3-phosphatase